ncbi:chitin deacetylase, partial [Blyttiomyces sp. JEL0837]
MYIVNRTGSITISIILLITASTSVVSADVCVADPSFPACLPVAVVDPIFGDTFKIPLPPINQTWTTWLLNHTDPIYPIPPIPPTTRGLTTPRSLGSPNANGVPAGPQNKATEIYMCGNKQWGLTIDDGPGKYTDDLLAVLKKHNVTATFFVIGANVVADVEYGKALKRVYDAGHQIAMHSWTHRHMTTQSTAQLISETIWTATAIYKILGKIPKYDRPPYGDIDDRIRTINVAFNLRTVMWNLQADDTTIPSTETLTTSGPGYHATNVTLRFNDTITKGSQDAFNWYPGGPPYPGFISLQHEIQKLYVDLVDAVIPVIKSKGFQFVSIAECDRRTMGNSSSNEFNPTGDFYLSDDAPLVKLVREFLDSITVKEVVTSGTNSTVGNGDGNGSGGNSGTMGST